MHLVNGELCILIPAAEPLRDCADALRRAEPTVLHALGERLRELVEPLGDEPQSLLLDALPDVLDKVARVLDGEANAQPALLRSTQQHVRHRAAQQLDLNQLLVEYGLLREVLIQQLPAALDRPLTLGESRTLHAALDVSAREAAVAFVTEHKTQVDAEAAAMVKHLSFLSHDMRGNLNGALLMIELLRRDLQAEPRFAESMGDLNAMRQSMLDLVGTMDRFLQAERLRHKRVEVSLQSLALSEFLHEQRLTLTRQQRPGSDGIEIECPADLAVSTDREMLSLVVQNLLSNCAKYGNGHPVTVRASARAADVTANVACDIEITDQGPGIPAELMERLFTPFTRGVDTGNGGRPGTGLGLFIAKQAADLIGARLDVASVPGHGTRFVIELPRPLPGRDYAKPA